MSKNTGTRRRIPQPIGADQRAAWKAELAAYHKRQRQQRGRGMKQDASASYRPGMNQIPAPGDYTAATAAGDGGATSTEGGQGG
jgi:hypothetical protein